MPEVDFSAQIKEKNLVFSSKSQKLGKFELSERAKTFLEAKASTFNEKAAKETSSDILGSVMQNGFEAAKNFLKPGISDLQIAVARLNRFLRYGDAKLLTVESVDLLDLEYSLASVTIAENKIAESDFKALIEVAASCECGDETETEDSEGKAVCSKCKKAKAKKSC